MQAFRNDSVYVVSAFDLKKNCAATRNNGDEAFLAACERDRRSIFVGDLPASITQDDLEELFSEAGDVLKINLIQRPCNVNTSTYSTTHPSNVRTMAFVEFAQPDMPETAIAKFHGKAFKGATMRVERKSVKDRGPTPRHSRSQLLLTHKPSEESVGQNVAHSRAPASPAVVSTPDRRTVGRPPAPVEMSPAPAGIPPMYGQWGYGATSPYGQNNYASYGGPSGGMPMTPQATPQMASPWSYYNSYWPNMMTAYDPSAFYMGPYAFQSPTPLMGGAAGGSGITNSHAVGGESQVQFTPTRGGPGQSNAEDGEGA